MARLSVSIIHQFICRRLNFRKSSITIYIVITGMLLILTTSWIINSNSNYELLLENNNTATKLGPDGTERSAKSQLFHFDLTPPPIPIIQAYTSKTSIYPGETLDLYVNSSENYRMKIYRIGSYKNGSDVALVYDDPALHRGLRQQDPFYNSTTNLIDPRWNKSFSLAVPMEWNTGVYFAQFTTDSSAVTYSLFVVKNLSNRGDIVMKLPVTTYQAYNAWGGKSLYEHQSDNRTIQNTLNPHIKRAFKVTFDRPYAQDNGMGQFLRYDLPLVRFLEKNGYDVSYITDVDLHENRKILDRFKALISSGHDEYWSHQMRQNLENARDKGLNIIFSSGNVAYWQIRFEDSFNGTKDRIMVCYKHKLLDPITGKNNSLVTVRWGEDPVNLPENALVGTTSTQPWNVTGSFTVVNSSNWIYKNTGFRDGDKVPGVIGYEVQHFAVNGFEPRNVTIIGHSRAENELNKTFADTVLFTTKIGAMIFSAGSIQWNWGLDDGSYISPKLGCNGDRCSDSRFQLMMMNVINKMIQNRR
jgi:hypothetical protein